MPVGVQVRHEHRTGSQSLVELAESAGSISVSVHTVSPSSVFNIDGLILPGSNQHWSGILVCCTFCFLFLFDQLPQCLLHTVHKFTLNEESQAKPCQRSDHLCQMQWCLLEVSATSHVQAVRISLCPRKLEFGEAAVTSRKHNPGS